MQSTDWIAEAVDKMSDELEGISLPQDSPQYHARGTKARDLVQAEGEQPSHCQTT